MSTRQKESLDDTASELLVRVEELEGAIATALKVNKLLNVEVEKYVLASSQLEADRDAWQGQARHLASRYRTLRRQAAGGGGADGEDEAEELARLLREKEADGQLLPEASTSGMAVQPSAAQAQVMSSLLTRGRMAGWIVKAEEVVLGRELGKGTFGTTYLGTWQGAQVAVKCVRVSKASELTTFLREVEAMSLLRHPNVVPFLGACLQPPDTFWLLAEYMPGGTLATWLKGTAPSSPPSTSGAPAASAGGVPSLALRARAGLEVARGMQALHSQSPCIMHRDLKPSNVFMDAGGHARVGDFGLARRLMPSESRATLTGETGTYLYMSPEVMRHDVYDLRCDVWSWGVLWAELMDEGRLPYWHLYMTPVQVALAVAEESLQPHIPDHLPTDLQVIGRLACQYDPEARPSFATIISELQPAVTAELEQANRRGTFLDHLQRFTASWSGIMKRAIYATKVEGAEDGHTAATVKGALPSAAGSVKAGPVSAVGVTKSGPAAGTTKGVPAGAFKAGPSSDIVGGSRQGTGPVKGQPAVR